MRKQLSIIIILFSIYSCKEKKEIYGCKDSNSPTYNPAATIDDNTCKDPADAFAGYYTGNISQMGFSGLPGAIYPINHQVTGITIQIQKIDKEHVTCNTHQAGTDSLRILTAHKDSIHLMFTSENRIQQVETKKQYHFLGKFEGNVLKTSERIIQSEYDFSTLSYLSQSDITTTGSFTK